MKPILTTSLILTIGLAGCGVKEKTLLRDSQLVHKYIKAESNTEGMKYARVYEFHPSYIKISEVLQNSQPGWSGYKVKFTSTSPSLYEAEHIYDVQNSPNIIVKKRKVVDDPWRGVIYKKHRLKCRIPIGEKCYISYKAKVLPLLHTRKAISAGKELHLGINTGSSSYKERYRVLAFPKDTKIIKVFNFLPTKKQEFQNWILFIYDLSQIKENVSYHVRFILPEKDIKELNLFKFFDEVLPKSQEQLEGETKHHLSSLRNAISIYYGDNEGEWPTKIEDLIPDYIKEIPKVKLGLKWESEGKNTVKIDLTPENKIQPQDIDEKTAWIYNNKTGNLKLNKKGKDSNGEFYSKW